MLRAAAKGRASRVPTARDFVLAYEFKAGTACALVRSYQNSRVGEAFTRFNPGMQRTREIVLKSHDLRAVGRVLAEPGAGEAVDVDPPGQPRRP